MYVWAKFLLLPDTVYIYYTLKWLEYSVEWSALHNRTIMVFVDLVFWYDSTPNNSLDNGINVIVLFTEYSANELYFE